MAGIAALQPPKKQSLDRAAADGLRQAIVSGRIAPGTRLTEVKLAEQFALSRGTVRAALQRLAAEGLVIQRPYAGWDVASLNVQDASELSLLRSALEGLAAGLAATRIDDRGRADITAAMNAIKEAAAESSFEKLVAADMALHSAIVELAGNQRLREHFDLTANQMRLYISSSAMLVEQMETVVQRHRELIAPILAGDAAAAERAARDHCVRSGEEIVAFLRQRADSARQSGHPDAT